MPLVQAEEPGMELLLQYRPEPQYGGMPEQRPSDVMVWPLGQQYIVAPEPGWVQAEEPGMGELRQ